MNFAWRPASKNQQALIHCPAFEVLFGGSRGGGKTDGVLGEWAAHANKYKANAVGLMVRRSRTELVETWARARAIYTPLGASFNESEKTVKMPGGARLRMAYLERDSDAEAYQGHSYTRVYVEEIGNFPLPGPVMKLMATLRSAAGVPVGFRATGNPGGPGHQWVKARYITPAPLGWQFIWSEFTNPFSGEIVKRDRVYIPSRITDNPYLGSDYVAQLQMVGSDELVRAWLLGDWDAVLGAFFDCWDSGKHVVSRRELPAHWLRFRAMDWGSAKPFSVGWYAVSDGELDEFPRGALIKYREWYGVKTLADGTFEPNVGLKMTAEEVADGIAEREAEDLAYAVIDPAAFAQDGGPSIAERINRRLVEKANGTRHALFHRADNKRVAAAGALGGWDQMRARLKGEDGGPMLFFFDNCLHSVRTIPALQHDQNKLEDVDTEAEDHAGDETRYGCMSRPYIRTKPEPKRGLGNMANIGLRAANTGMTFDDYREAIRRERRDA